MAAMRGDQIRDRKVHPGPGRPDGERCVSERAVRAKGASQANGIQSLTRRGHHYPDGVTRSSVTLA